MFNNPMINCGHPPPKLENKIIQNRSFKIYILSDFFFFKKRLQWLTTKAWIQFFKNKMKNQF